jgi:ABC-2 type transport system ATP-binding protein
VPEVPAIETFGLSKTFQGGIRALVDLDIHVEQGEVYGFLGPNGAGKSTTIRLLLDLIRPTAGHATLLGRHSQVDGVAVRRRIGYLPGDLRLYDRLTVRQQLESLARLRGGVDPTYRDELVERFDVPLDRLIRELSKGNRQKIGLVQAFMHRPELLILDEPTGGLDPILQEEFRILLRETVAMGHAAFLSSHSLDEVQRVADRVAIIREGKLIDIDSVHSLRERALRHVEITFASPVDSGGFAAIDGVRVQEVEGRLLRLVATPTAMNSVVKAAARHELVDLVSAPAELEEIFLDLYRESRHGH